MLSLVFAALFGVSLLPGRVPLCWRFALRVSDGIVPDGAFDYCRRLTAVWFAVLLANAAALAAVGALCPWPWWRQAAFGAAVSACTVSGTFFAEGLVRRRRFRVVFHTSGSTAAPKSIVKTFESLAREVAYHRSTLAHLGRPRFLATVEPGHMYGTLWRRMLPAAMGAECDPEVIMTPESLLAKMRAADRVILVTTPSFLDRFTAYAADGQYDVPRNAVEIVTSGALLRADTARRTEAVFGIAPREIFGSTETGGVAWRRQGSGAPAPADGCDWQVLPAVSVSLSDGCIAVRSPYSCAPRYVMGDGAELSADRRRFRLLGRRDRLVKVNEQRVSLPEMEERTRALDGVADVALTALEGEHGAILGAVVVPSGALPAGAEEKRRAALELRGRMIGFFPRGTVPKRYRFVAELPRNPQGKVRADALRALFETEGGPR